jgi:polyisoprenoid-binding protein YceI
MQFQKTLGLALGLAALAISPAIASDVYTFDGAHSTLGFQVVHMGIFKASGTFDKFVGTVNYDPKDVTKSTVDVSVDVASVNTRTEMRDKHLRSADFFDVEKFPTATFKSTKVEAGKDGRLLVTGDFTLHGVTKSIVLDSAVIGAAQDDWGNQRLGFEGHTTVSRKDYGVAWNNKTKTGTVIVADSVDISINGEGIKAKPADADKK